MKKNRLVLIQETLQQVFSNEITERNTFLLTPSSNFKVVTVRSNRICSECFKTLAKDTRCYTINPKGKGRKWVCFSCISEPNKPVSRIVGEIHGSQGSTELVYYSDVCDKFGRHKGLGELSDDEYESYEARRETQITEDALDDF